MRIANFIKICVFRDIDFIILQRLYFIYSANFYKHSSKNACSFVPNCRVCVGYNKMYQGGNNQVF